MDYQIWTSWIQAISAALGIPAAIAGFVLLFLKDLWKERQIKELESIAKHQSTIAEEMQKQVAELGAQTKIMERSNEINAEHLLTIREAFTDIAQEKQKENIYREQKELESIKPYFIYNGGGKTHPNYMFRLKNIGNVAHIEEISVLNNPEYFFLNLPEKDRTVEKNGGVTITFQYKGGRNSHTYPNFKAEMIVKDQAGNLYRQIINSIGSQYSLDAPEPVEKTIPQQTSGEEQAK